MISQTGSRRQRLQLVSLSAVVSAVIISGAISAELCSGATPGLPFIEDFTDAALCDDGETTAFWSTAEGAAYMDRFRPRYKPFDPESAGVVIAGTDQYTLDVALADVDGDGDQDLVNVKTADFSMLFLNNGTTDPFSGVTGIDITGGGQAGTCAALGDLDRDGDQDLVIGTAAGEPARLLLNDGSSTPFAMTGAIEIGGDRDTACLALGDLDGDGDLDLVLGNVNQPNQLFLNNGTADPFAGVTPSDISDAALETRAVALGDLDSDGDLDLVAGNSQSNCQAFLNNGSSDPFAGVTGTVILETSLYILSIALGDVDADGYLDLVVPDVGDGHLLFLNNGSADPFAGVEPVIIETGSGSLFILELCDIDHDADLDLIDASQFSLPCRYFLNNGSVDPFTGMGWRAFVGLPMPTCDVAIGDLDGDGDLDVLFESIDEEDRMYLNNGTADPFSGVAPVLIKDVPDSGMRIETCDVDGDGDVDFVAQDPTRLFKNNGTPDPFTGVTGDVIDDPPGMPFDYVFSDADSDGDPDLFIAIYAEYPNRLYLNNGTDDPFQGVAGADIGTDTGEIDKIAVGDVDGDGDPDLIAGYWRDTNRLFLNNGSSDPFAGVTSIEFGSSSENTAAVALIDIDRDGDLDLLAGNENSQDQLYLNDGAANPFSAGICFDPALAQAQTQWIVCDDFDHDGWPDIVAELGTEGIWRFRRNLYAGAAGRLTSTEIDLETDPIESVWFSADYDQPAHSRIRFYLSNNGGERWYQVQSGRTFQFPTTGADLRWRAELSTESPVKSPRLTRVIITDGSLPTPSPAPTINPSWTATPMMTWTPAPTSSPPPPPRRLRHRRPAPTTTTKTTTLAPRPPCSIRKRERTA